MNAAATPHGAGDAALLLAFILPFVVIHLHIERGR